VASSPWLAASFVNAPNYNDARSQQYNLQLQQQLTPSTIFSVGYAGSKTDRLNFTGRVNAAPVASSDTTPSSAIDALKLISMGFAFMELLFFY